MKHFKALQINKDIVIQSEKTMTLFVYLGRTEACGQYFIKMSLGK